MLSILQRAIFVYTDRSVGAASPAVLRIGNGTVMGVPVTVPLVLVVAALARCCCNRTRFGLHVRVVGANERRAAFGIDVARGELPVFICPASSAAVAGASSSPGAWAPALSECGDRPRGSMRSSPWSPAARRCQEDAAPSSETLAAVMVLGVTANLLNLLGMYRPSSRWW